MHYSMRKFLFAFLMMVMAALPERAQASHAAGAELTYVWLSDSTYRFYAKFYRDCSGISEPSSISMCINNTCTGFSTSITLTKMTTIPGGGSNGTSVSTGCPGNPTSCNGGSVTGFREWWYSGTYTLPSRCSEWKFSFYECCRNSAITNLTNPSNYEIYIEATLNNTNGQTNTSPSFTNKPTPYVCTNQPFSYNNGTVEINGDSLYFESIQPRFPTTLGCPYGVGNIPYSSILYNATNNPFNTNNTFSCDPATGTVSFTAPTQQVPMVTIRCKEYRNGVLIGSVMRDVQMVIANCNTAIPVQTLLTNTITNATFDTLTGFVTQGCFNPTPITFCYSISSANANAVLIPTDNHIVALPGSTVTYTGLGTDSVVGCVSWTPTLADTGLSLLVINVKDSTCTVGSPFIVTNSITIPIYIGNFVGLNGINVTNVINCLIPNTGGIFTNVSSNVPNLTYTLAPGGITNTTGLFTSLPVGIYTLSVSDGSICTLTTLVNIISPNAPTFNNPTTTPETCNLNNGSINAPATAPNGGVVTYNLMPGSITNTSGIFTGLSGGTYTVTASDAFLCSNSTILTVVDIVPPSITAALNSTACPGGAASLVVSQIAGASTPFMYNLNGGTYQTGTTFAGITNGTYTVGVKDSNNCTNTFVINVALPAPLTFTTFTTSNPWCVPDNNGSINAVATGGTGLLLYSNSGGVYGVNGNFNNLIAGTYTIFVKDANNCTATSVATLNVPSSPSIDSIKTTPANCGGAVGTATLYSTGGFGAMTYALSAPLQLNGSGVFTGLQAGIYNVAATDAKGCAAMSTVQIVGTPNPLVNGITKTPLTCGNSNGSIIISASGGTPGYTYSNGGGFLVSNTFTSLGSTIYTVTVKDNAGCTNTSVVTLAVAPSPSISLSAPPIACASGNTTLTVNINSGNSTPFQYSVNNSAYQFGNTFSVGSGNYTVTVKDSNNCTATATISLANPSGLVINSIAQTVASCNPGNDATFSIAASGGSGLLQYSLNSGPLQSANAFNSLGLGSYTATVADANGCTASTIFTIQQSPPVNISFNNATPNYCLKSNGTASVIASAGTPGYTYSLNGTNLGNNGGNFSGLSTATYTLAVTDSKGCSATTTVAIAAVQGPTFSNIAIVPNSCNLNNGSLTLSATSPASITNYSIGSQNNSTGIFNSLAGGLYTITVQDANNCSTSAITNLPNAPSPVINLTATPIACHNGTTTINVNLVSGNSTPISYTLNNGTSQLSTSFLSLASGSYTVVATDSNGCTNSSTLLISNPPLLEIASLTHISPTCNPNFDGVLSATAIGGTGAIQFQLNGGTAQSSGNFSGLTSGTYTIVATDSKGCSTSGTHIVTPSPSVSLSVASTSPDYCSKTNGTINVTTTAGTSPFTYALDGTSYGSNGGSFNSLASAIYSIVVTDANGCTSQTTANVGAVAGPTITSVLTVNNTCNLVNGQVNIAATTPGLLTNFNLGSSNNLSGQFGGLVGGTYTVTVTDNNNCTATATASLQNAPSPVIALQANPILCNNGVTTLNVNLQSGNSTPITYSLNNGAAQVQAQFTSVSSGSYTVIANDSNNCKDTSVITLANPSPVVVTGTNHIIPTCTPGSDGILTVNATGGVGAIQYQINNGGYQSTNVFNGLVANLYNVMVQDANGCTATASVTINNPTPPVMGNIVTTLETCTPGSDATAWAIATGGTGLINYSTNNGGNWQANQQFTSLTSGTYTMTAQDAKFCTTTVAFTINNFAAVTINVDTVNHIQCESFNNGRIVVSSSGGTGNKTYVRQPGNISNTTGIFNNLAPTTYTIVVTDSAGCSNTSVVTITEPTALSIDSTIANHIACNGNPNGSIVIGASGGTGNLLYTLQPNNLSQFGGTFGSLVASNYTLQVTDANGCTLSVATAITQPVIQTITNVTSIPALCNATATGTISASAVGGSLPYMFYIGSDTSSTGVFNNMAAGIYTVLCVDAQNCATTSITAVQQPSVVQFLNAYKTDAICYNDNSGTITCTANGGVGAKTFTLLPTGATNTTGNFTNVGAGFYTIVATDANGCTSLTNISV
ncbi:MAG: hypothetical protein RL660_1312, partial [Bacteroidota bacterium]